MQQYCTTLSGTHAMDLSTGDPLDLIILTLAVDRYAFSP